MGEKYHTPRIGRYVLRLIFSAFCAWILNISKPTLAQDEVTLTPETASRLALKNNEKVLKAQNVLERAKANLQTARSFYVPQIGLTGSHERRKNDDLDLDERDYLSSVSLSQVIARFSEVPQDLDQAQENVRKSDIELKSAEQEVIFTLRRFWHNITIDGGGDSTTKHY